MSLRSKALLQLCLVHLTLLLALWVDSLLGLLAFPSVRALLVLACLSNAALFWRRWSVAKLAPPSPIVPSRIRKHLLLLKIARPVTIYGLLVGILLACLALWNFNSYSAMQLLPLLFSPLVLVFKIRWLGNWQHRLEHQAQSIAGA